MCPYCPLSAYSVEKLAAISGHGPRFFAAMDSRVRCFFIGFKAEGIVWLSTDLPRALVQGAAACLFTGVFACA
jgi:hypothetical protein